MTTICCTGGHSMGLVLISFCVLESTLLLTCGRCECLAAVGPWFQNLISNLWHAMEHWKISVSQPSMVGWWWSLDHQLAYCLLTCSCDNWLYKLYVRIHYIAVLNNSPTRSFCVSHLPLGFSSLTNMMYWHLLILCSGYFWRVWTKRHQKWKKTVAILADLFVVDVFIPMWIH